MLIQSVSILIILWMHYFLLYILYMVNSIFFFFFSFALVHESTLSTNCEEVSFCSSGSAGCWIGNKYDNERHYHCQWQTKSIIIIIPSISRYFRCMKKAYIGKLTPISGITKFFDMFCCIREAMNSFLFLMIK